MFKKIVVLTCVSCLSLSALGDYVQDRVDAMALVKSGKQEEALAAFLKMAQPPATDIQKSDALEQAANCAAALKQKDRAMELAKQIPIVPLSKYCQMQLLENDRLWQQIIDQFKDEDFDSWPQGIKGDAYFLRGQAYLITQNGQAAESDLKKAVENVTNQNTLGLVFNYLGDTYHKLLKNDDLAIETYRKTYKTENIYKQAQAAISIAIILREKQQYDQALEELNQLDMKELTSAHWRGKVLCNIGRIYFAAGKKPQAIEKYNEALQLKGLPQEIKELCEMSLKDAQVEPKP